RSGRGVCLRGMGRTLTTQETIPQSATRPECPLPTKPPSHARLVPPLKRGNLWNLRGHFSFFPQNTPEGPPSRKRVGGDPFRPQPGYTRAGLDGKNSFHSGVIVHAHSTLPGGDAADRGRPCPLRPGKARSGREKSLAAGNRCAAEILRRHPL